MLNKKISLCKFIGRENFVVSWMLEISKQYANFEVKCPFRPGNYTMKEFPIDGSIFPPVLPEMQFRVYFFMSAQVPGLTSTKEIYSVISTAQLKWN